MRIQSSGYHWVTPENVDAGSIQNLSLFTCYSVPDLTAPCTHCFHAVGGVKSVHNISTSSSIVLGFLVSFLLLHNFTLTSLDKKLRSYMIVRFSSIVFSFLSFASFLAVKIRKCIRPQKYLSFHECVSCRKGEELSLMIRLSVSGSNFEIWKIIKFFISFSWHKSHLCSTIPLESNTIP